MKVKIVTLWGAYNFGAFLQAYSLGKFLESNDIMINYSRENGERKKMFSFISKSISKTIYQLKMQNKFKKSQKIFKIENSIINYDFSIVGADEVWNVNNNFFNHELAFIGIDENAEKSISYAASSNGAKSEEFVNIYGKEAFSNFSHISVRDKATQKMVYDITNTNPTIVLDPTFLINYDDLSPLIDYNYIFVYGYSFKPEEINQIKMFAKNKNLKVVSAGPFLDWTDVKMAIGPFEFLRLCKFANFIFTSTFHGTVFSIIFNKPFYSFARNNVKVIELLGMFNLDKRNASSNLLTDDKIDYLLVNKIIDKKREESIDFLKKSLDI